MMSAGIVSEKRDYVNLQITIILNELACLYKRSGDYKEMCVSFRDRFSINARTFASDSASFSPFPYF